MSGRVIILGSINVDLLTSVQRLPVAGETVTGDSITRQLGGKGANQAVAVARADVPSILLGAVGDDADGKLMIESLTSYGVDTARIASTPGHTGCALVITSRQDNQIVVLPGANASVDRPLVASVSLRSGDICLAQMEIPPTATMEFFARARAAGATTILNAAPAGADVLPLLPLTDILIVNESELALLSDCPVEGLIGDRALTDALVKLGPDRPGTVIVTLGAEGFAIASGDTLRRIAGESVSVVDTTGAGDCFCGYLAAGLARGESLVFASIEANVAASIAVQSLGAASAVPARSTILPMIAAAHARGS